MKKYQIYLYVFVSILGIITLRDYLIKTRSLPRSNDTGSYETKSVQKSATAEITFSKIKIHAEVADTMEKRELGLSFRNNLDENTGMLFVFENPIIPFFWMKDMNFPLDIIWIKDGVIVDIDRDIPIPKEGSTLNQLPKYSPSERIDYALEVNAGFTDTNKIKVGDKITITFN